MPNRVDDLVIRSAERRDIPAIVEMLADDVYGAERERVENPTAGVYIEAFHAISADPNNELVVACRNDTVVGVFQLTFVPGMSYQGGWRAMIEGVRVAAPYRSQGIGARMMSWAVRRAEERGCVLVELTSNAGRPDAHRFYERLGFVRSHVGMKRALRQP